jgi:hypothetical protein
VELVAPPSADPSVLEDEGAGARPRYAGCAVPAVARQDVAVANAEATDRSPRESVVTAIGLVEALEIGGSTPVPKDGNPLQPAEISLHGSPGEWQRWRPVTRATTGAPPVAEGSSLAS